MSEKKKNFLSEFWRFINIDIWRLDRNSAPRMIRPFIAPTRILFMIGHDFIQKNTMSKASALSYTSVLGLIPLLIIAVIFSKGFLRDQAEEMIPKAIDYCVVNLAPQLDSIPAGEDGDRMKSSAKELAVKKLSSILLKLDAGKLGLFGIIPFIFIAYSMLRTIENTMDEIWNVKRGRPIWQQFLQYWLLITLLPFVLLLTMGLTGTQVFMKFKGLNHHLSYFILLIVPYVTLWTGFTIFYKIVPNTQVIFRSALIGGIIGGTLWQINNKLSFMYVSKAVELNAFYGSIAIIPIFLIALYFGWLIILFGAHVAFAIQNIELFRCRHLATDLKPLIREKIALAAMLEICGRFERGQPPPDRQELSELTGIPDTFFEDVIPCLGKSGLIREHLNSDTDYLPAKPTVQIRLRDIIESVSGKTSDEIPFKSECESWKKARKACDHYSSCVDAKANLTISELLR